MDTAFEVPSPRLSPSVRALLLVFLLSLGLRVGYLLIVLHGPLGNGDSPTYELLAEKLAGHQPYLTPNAGWFSDDLVRPAGYPLFLALVNSSSTISRARTAAVQCALSASFAVLLAILVGRVTNGFAGLLAGILYATDWATIIHAPLVIAETLFVILLGTAVCLYAFALTRKSALLSLSSGLFLGLAVLVKPIAQVVVIAFLLGWLFQEKRRPAGLVFLLSYLLCVGPWIARNYREHGVATVSPIGVVNLYVYTAQASAHPHPVSDLSGSALNKDLTGIRADWAARPISASERTRAMERETMALVLQHWPTVLRQSAIGMARTCFGTGFITVADSLPQPPGRLTKLLAALLPFVGLVPLWGLAFVGTFSSLAGANRAVRIMLASSVVLLLLPAASAVGQSRFRVSAVPALSVLAAIGAAQLRGPSESAPLRKFATPD